MSTISITEQHNLGQEVAKDKIGVFEEMVQKFGVKVVWSGFRAEIKGMGISGDIDVQSDSIALRLKLGMMAKAAGVKADKLEGSIKRRIQEALNG